MFKLSHLTRLILTLILAFGCISSSAVYSDEAEMTVSQSVNVNSASAEEISEVLDGIGLKRAQAIVEYRNANGKFESLEDLLEVKGVGEKTLENNRDAILL